MADPTVQTNISLLERTTLTFMVLALLACAVGLVVVLTARCEGFGCIALGPVAALSILCEAVGVAAGALVWWRWRQRGRPRRWLEILLIVASLPLVWFALRLMLHG